jgi:hypothetical protein
MRGPIGAVSWVGIQRSADRLDSPGTVGDGLLVRRGRRWEGMMRRFGILMAALGVSAASLADGPSGKLRVVSPKAVDIG